MEIVGMIKPTSKAALKQQCLFLSNLDVKKASEMYDFLIKDMEEIPAVEPATKSFIQNFGDQANGVVGWVRENQDMIERGFGFIRDLLASRKGGTAAKAAAQELPIINP